MKSASPNGSPGGRACAKSGGDDPARAVTRFAHFAAIDWSGAIGERLPGIAVALCPPGDAPPALVRPAHRWSRAEVLRWLAEEMPADTLVGLDLGLSFPFADRGAFFPGWDASPPDARALWALVERVAADDPHGAASSFVDHADASRHFRRHGGRTGDLFGIGRGRLRVTEQHQAEAGLNPVSNFNLVGAAQVGKSSLTGMRALHRLAGRVPIWPIDRDPGHGSLIVEIYTGLIAREAGRPRGRSKMTSVEALDLALALLGSRPTRGSGAITDHRSDALLGAAWLRAVADRPSLWAPRGLTSHIARTEGWTFGVG